MDKIKIELKDIQKLELPDGYKVEKYQTIRIKIVILSLLLSIVTFGQNPLLEDLSGYWKLDEAFGSIISEVNGLDGTNNGAIPNQPGKINKAYSFSADKYIQLPTTGTYLSMYNTDFSFAAWVYITGYTSSDRVPILGSLDTGGALLVIKNNGKLTFIRRNQLEYSGSTGTVSLNTWTHIGVSFNVSTGILTYYINGQPSGTISGIVAAQSGTYTNYIGQRNSDIASIYYIDEVGIWKKALTTTDFENLYNSGNGLSYPFSISTGGILPIGSYANFPIGSEQWISYIDGMRIAKYPEIIKPTPPEPPDDNFTIYEYWDFENISLGEWTKASIDNYFRGGHVTMWHDVDIIQDEIDNKSTQVFRTINRNDILGGGFEMHYFLDDYYDEIYFSYNFKADENFQNTAGGKLPGFRGDPGATGFTIGEEDGFLAHLMFKYAGYIIQYYYLHQAPYWPTSEEQFDVSFVPGTWHTITVRLVMNSFTGEVANADGVQETWLDGNLILQDNTLMLREIKHDTLKIDQIKFAYFYGGNDPAYLPVSNTYGYFDNFVTYVPNDDPTLGTRNLHSSDYKRTSPVDIENSYFYYDSFIDTERTLSNSEYGNNYSSGINEAYLIDAGEGNTVTYTFSGTLGGRDDLFIYDGNKVGAELIHLSKGYKVLSETVTSTGRYMYIRFSSSNDVGTVGFTGTISFNYLKVLFIGNSTMVDIDDIFITDGEPYDLTSIAVEGHTSLNQLTEWNKFTTQEKESFDYILVQVGLNDCSQLNPTTRYQTLISALATDKKDNTKIIAGLMTPVAQGAWGRHTEWLQLNYDIENIIIGIDYLVTGNRYDLDLNNDNYLDNNFDSGDGIHPNNIGSQIMKDNFVNGIKHFINK